MRWIGSVVVLVSLCCAPALAAESPASPDVPAEPPSAPLKVAISPFVPLVFVEEGTRPRGYSIELWERVAAELELPYEYVTTEGVAKKLELLTTGRADVAIGGITLTAERERRVDFTYPTLAAGLSILVKPSPSPGIFQSLKSAFTRTRVSIVLGFLLLVVLSGHLMWIAERGKEAFSDKYIPGVLEGMYWAVVTASTVGYGDKAPAKWAGRFLAMLVIVVSLPLFALFTAELASALTLEEIQSQIRGPGDLEGKRTGVVRDTESAHWASARGLSILQYDRASELYAALLAGEVDAVVYDAPSLAYFAQNEGRGKVHLVGAPFLEQELGMALPEDSPLRERINRALLELQERGELSRIRVKWFG